MPREQYPLEVHGIQTILDEGLDVHEMTVRDLLTEILKELKKANVYNAINTDEEITVEDIEDDY
ncbi:hypothetical protein KAX02_13685 [candidate division WOR-3 bacterium]|nr:hypothetical protein [candidate division WOR-3 bacterium]